MEDLYSVHPVINRRFGSSATSSDEISAEIGGGSDLTDLLKYQIWSHPRYPSLVSAYIECRKVGAPLEMATMLDEIGRESTSASSSNSCLEMGSDSELDEFMESYCLLLEKYKEELSKPFDEAETFLSSVKTQLRSLCNDCTNDDAVGSSEEELSYGDVETSKGQVSSNSLAADNELKEMLLKKYSGYLSSLRNEFLKKRKKGKLPKDARSTLLDWWNTHYRWPYPTEEEKAKLAETTGLDQKQINNWFINQRKRHWKPSEDMRFALMEGVSDGSSGATLYFDTGMIGPGTS